MSNSKHGGAAFPRPAIIHPDSARILHEAVAGMSLRDHFAGLALTGLLADGDPTVCESETPEGIEAERQEYALVSARAAYRYADAMLKARDE